MLLYYTAAQQIGESGLELIRRFAERHAKLARRLEPKSLKMLTGGVSPPSAAYDQLKQGPKLISQQLALFIALNGEPHRALQTTLNTLSLQHGLEIGVAAVLKRDQVTVWRPERRVQPL